MLMSFKHRLVIKLIKIASDNGHRALLLSLHFKSSNTKKIFIWISSLTSNSLSFFSSPFESLLSLIMISLILLFLFRRRSSSQSKCFPSSKTNATGGNERKKSIKSLRVSSILGVRSLAKKDECWRPALQATVSWRSINLPKLFKIFCTVKNSYRLLSRQACVWRLKELTRIFMYHL